MPHARNRGGMREEGPPDGPPGARTTCEEGGPSKASLVPAGLLEPKASPRQGRGEGGDEDDGE